MEVPDTEKEYNTAMKLILIARKAKEEPKLKFTSLMHLLNVEYLKECFGELKRNRAGGVDGRTVESYSAEEIEWELKRLVERLKSRKYRPQAARRVYIEKTGGGNRPLGIPTVIDRILQRALSRILEPIYEPLFLKESYGFRKGRSAHECLKELNHVLMGKKVNWIIDADIKGFFDHVEHGWMEKCLEQRIVDPAFKVLIRRFMKAGVMEEGRAIATARGTPQGGNLSPMLANIYLHYVLDVWFQSVKTQFKGEVYLVRYADDFIVGAQYEHEARQILEELRQRLAKFGLELSPGKTGIKEFGRFAARNHRQRGQGKPETFDFLGFTHYCTTTRDGRFMVRVKTSRKKMNKTIVGMNRWLKAVRNLKPLNEIWEMLIMKLRGHYNYYGLSGNFPGINRYYTKTRNLVFKWMNRRSQKRTWNWESFEQFLAKHPLPKPRLTYAIYNTW